MPVDGLSLVGFMESKPGIDYLKNACVLPDVSPKALQKEWNEARAKRGSPIPNAGKPDVQDIPNAHLGYLNGVKSKKEFAAAFQGKWEFKLVEIAPILAYQHHLVLGHSASLCAGINDPAGQMGDLIKKCLPQNPQAVPVRTYPQSNGIMIKSDSLNICFGDRGAFQPDPKQSAIFGIRVNATVPLIQVVRHQGRCYLHNGYHRTYGFAKAGATHIPCILRDVEDFSQVGAMGMPSTFDRILLESADPPTVGHFVQGRAWPVQLRKMVRVANVVWSEGICPDE